MPRSCRRARKRRWPNSAAWLQNAQSILDALETGVASLSGEGGALEPLSAARRAMAGVAQYRADYADVAEKLNDGYYALEDLSYTLRDLRDAFHYDPEELNRIEERLELLSRSSANMARTPPKCCATGRRLARKYELLDTFEQRRGALVQAYDEALAAYTALAQQLERGAPARRGGVAGAPAARTKRPWHAACVVFGAVRPPSGRRALGRRRGRGRGFCSPPTAANRSSRLRAWRPAGRFRASCWRFKRVLADSDGIATLVFDEIDSGVSGQIGNAVAQKMRQIACTRAGALHHAFAADRRLRPGAISRVQTGNGWKDRVLHRQARTTKAAAANWSASWAAGRTIRLRCAMRASCSTTRSAGVNGLRETA